MIFLSAFARPIQKRIISSVQIEGDSLESNGVDTVARLICSPPTIPFLSHSCALFAKNSQGVGRRGTFDNDVETSDHQQSEGYVFDRLRDTDRRAQSIPRRYLPILSTFNSQLPRRG